MMTTLTSGAKEVASARDVKTVNGRELMELVEDADLLADEPA
jgi:hypothetical protein